MPITVDSVSETASAAAAAASMNAGSLIGSPLKTADGLAFVTLGRLSSNMSVRDNKPAIEIMAADQTPTLAASLQRPQSGIKRKSSQTNWTVPPRILLVDDDSVYRDLSGKLLQVIGCTIDLAKDGVEALKKMGLEKYDLILMVGVLLIMRGDMVLILLLYYIRTL
jgi:osomolarity two-component system response regulator SKN7